MTQKYSIRADKRKKNSLKMYVVENVRSSPIN